MSNREALKDFTNDELRAEISRRTQIKKRKHAKEMERRKALGITHPFREASKVARKKRCAEAYEMKKNGQSTKAIAEHFGVSRSRVWVYIHTQERVIAYQEQQKALGSIGEDNVA